MLKREIERTKNELQKAKEERDKSKEEIGNLKQQLVDFSIELENVRDESHKRIPDAMKYPSKHFLFIQCIFDFMYD